MCSHVGHQLMLYCSTRPRHKASLGPHSCSSSCFITITAIRCATRLLCIGTMIGTSPLTCCCAAALAVMLLPSDLQTLIIDLLLPRLSLEDLQ